jgi:hypothetical protein
VHRRYLLLRNHGMSGHNMPWMLLTDGGVAAYLLCCWYLSCWTFMFWLCLGFCLFLVYLTGIPVLCCVGFLFVFRGGWVM